MVDLREDKPLSVLVSFPYVDMGVAIHQFLFHRGLVREPLCSSDHRGNWAFIVLLGILISLDTWQQSVPCDRFTVAVSSFPAFSSIMDGLHDFLLLLNNICWVIDHKLSLWGVVSEASTADTDAALIVATHELRRCNRIVQAATHVCGLLPSL